MNNIAKIGLAACVFFTLFEAAAFEKGNLAASRSTQPNDAIMVAATDERSIEKELQRNRSEREKLDRERKQLEKEKAEHAKSAFGKRYEDYDCRETGRNKNGVITLKCTPHKKQRKVYSTDAERQRAERGQRNKD